MNLKQEEEKIVYSINRVNNQIISPTEEELFQINKNSYYHSNNKKCVICNTKFNHGQSNYKICNGCKIITQCPECMKINTIEIKNLRENHFNFLLDCINKNELNKFYCFCNKKCMLSFRNKLPTMINASLKNLEKAEKYWKDHDRTEHFRKYWRQHTEEWGQALINYIKNNPDKVKENAIKQSKYIETLWKDDVWRNEIGLPSRENGIKASQSTRIEIIKNSLAKLNLIITKTSIDVSYDNLQNLRKNDICSAYLIRAKYKENNNIYDLLTCKSKYIYDEIFWILKVLSQPKIQIKEISKENSWTYVKWWYIANLYENFEFILLTDPNGVSEEEALLAEAKYAINHNMLVEFDKSRIPQIDYEVHNGKHGYWSL